MAKKAYQRGSEVISRQITQAFDVEGSGWRAAYANMKGI